jgi:hypothetical protein
MIDLLASGTPLIITVPPAAKVLAVSGAVYGILLAAKKIPALTGFLQGWVAIAFNVALTIAGLVITIPADQLYTVNTALTLISTALAAAGVHGTVKSMSAPTVLATIPPSTQVKEVPATLVPDNPKAVVTDSPAAPKQ